MSKIRKTTQYLMPVSRKKPGALDYDIYPVHDLGDGTVSSDISELAARIRERGRGSVEGYGGVRFDGWV